MQFVCVWFDLHSDMPFGCTLLFCVVAFRLFRESNSYILYWTRNTLILALRVQCQKWTPKQSLSLHFVCVCAKKNVFRSDGFDSKSFVAYFILQQKSLILSISNWTKREYTGNQKNFETWLKWVSFESAALSDYYTHHENTDWTRHNICHAKQSEEPIWVCNFLFCFVSSQIFFHFYFGF